MLAQSKVAPVREALASPALRVIVAQIGARRRYAVPRMLQTEGVLSRLYTDLAVMETSHLPSYLRQGRLGRRTITGIPSERVWRSPWSTLQANLSRPRLAVEAYLHTDETFGRRMIEWGLGDASTIYGMYGSGTPFWRHARAHGVKVACDMFITPLWHEIVLRERIAFPDWEAPTAEQERETALFGELNRRCIGAADMILCPSDAVRDDLTTLIRREAEPGKQWPRLEVVPYGTAVRSSGVSCNPVEGRILFAGAADLRKGIHILAEAERRLNARARRYEIRVAGLASDTVRTHPKSSRLTFLGHLARAALDAEYAAADVLWYCRRSRKGRQPSSTRHWHSGCRP